MYVLFCPIKHSSASFALVIQTSPTWFLKIVFIGGMSSDLRREFLIEPEHRLGSGVGGVGSARHKTEITPVSKGLSLVACLIVCMI